MRVVESMNWLTRFVVVGLLVAAGCGISMDEEHPDSPPLVEGEARVLAERAGCPTNEGEAIHPEIGGHSGDSGYECVIEGRWTVRVVAGMLEQVVDDAVSRLNQRRQFDIRCADGELSNPGVVAGDDWVVFVSNHEGAQVVAERLDGEFRPNEIAGPPDGQVNLPCPPPS
jgi:hypothetical protein